MTFDVEQYDVRILELHSLRLSVNDKVQTLLTRWKIDTLLSKIEQSILFDWLVTEALSVILRCKIPQHWEYDLGRTVYNEIKDVVEKVLQITLSQTGLENKHQQIEHVKVMTLGVMLIIGVRYK